MSDLVGIIGPLECNIKSFKKKKKFSGTKYRYLMSWLKLWKYCCCVGLKLLQIWYFSWFK